MERSEVHPIKVGPEKSIAWTRRLFWVSVRRFAPISSDSLDDRRISVGKAHVLAAWAA